MIAPAQAIDASSCNRYLIYEMLDREVTFEYARSGRRYSGVVEQVVRDIFQNQVQLILNGRLFRFDEPVVIVKTSDGGTSYGTVVFVYGDLTEEQSDEELFEHVRNSSEFYGETVHDVLSRTKPKTFHFVRFLLGRPILRRRTWRMRDKN